jgi:hypothetical protein
MSRKNLRCSCFCCSCFQHHNLQHSKPWWKVMDSQWSWSLKFMLVPIDKMLDPFITDTTPKKTTTLTYREKQISKHINNVPEDQKSEYSDIYQLHWELYPCMGTIKLRC